MIDQCQVVAYSAGRVVLVGEVGDGVGGRNGVCSFSLGWWSSRQAGNVVGRRISMDGGDVAAA